MPASNEQVQPYTAAGYTYVEESGDKADKSAYLNTNDKVIAIQQRWQNGTCGCACTPLAVALPPFVELLQPWQMSTSFNVIHLLYRRDIRFSLKSEVL